MGQIAPRLRLAQAAACPQFIDDALGRVELVVGLGKVADLNAVAQRQLPVQRLDLAQHGTQEGALAAAVRPQQRRPATALQFQLADSEQGPPRIANRRRLGPQHDAGAALHRLQANVEAGRAGAGRPQLPDALDRLVDRQRPHARADLQPATIAASHLGHRRQSDLVDEGQVARQLAQAPLGDVGLAAGDVALDEVCLFL